MPMPLEPKIYHICHVDKLPSIVEAGCLWSDAEASRRASAGTAIGMSDIKARRREMTLASHPGLHVGECVPFYFCPRSVMLYLIGRANHQNLAFYGGQEPIIHLEADLHATVGWANAQTRRWAFTLSNAGARYFEDRANLEQLNEIDWEAVAATNWSSSKEGKQAEFLVELSFPWHLVERIGVCSSATYGRAVNALPVLGGHRPSVEVLKEWYY